MKIVLKDFMLKCTNRDKGYGTRIKNILHKIFRIDSFLMFLFNEDKRPFLKKNNVKRTQYGSNSITHLVL